VAYTFGLFFVEISADLKGTKSATSWIVSIMTGITYASGPISSALVNKYGCRAVSIAGSVTAALGFGVSYFAESVTFLYLSIGLVGGIGLGMIYLPAIVSVTCYFEKRRAFATGIAVCGSGFGTFVLAPITERLIHMYEWRGALLIASAILLSCAVFSALFRPLAESKENQDAERGAGIANGTGAPVSIPDIDIVESSPTHVEASAEPLLNTNSDSQSLQANADESLEEPGEIMSVPNIRGHASRFLTSRGKDTLTMSCSHPVLPVGIGSMDSLHKFNYSTRQTARHSLKFGSEVLFEGATSRNRRKTSGTLDKSTSTGLIMQRKDIFYSGSMANLNNIPVKRPDKVETLTERMVRTPDDSNEALAEKNKKFCGCIPCSPEFNTVMDTMMDFSILKNPVFLYFAVSNFFTSLGYNVPYVYIVDMAIGDAKNPLNDKASAGFLLSIVGISNTLSRVVLGYLSDKKWMNRLYLYNICLAICGLATGLSSHTTDLFWLRVYAATFGATVGVYVSLTSVILVDLVGLDKLTNAFGLLLLFEGAASVIGPPIVGKLYDEFNDYRPGFWLAGAMFAFSGLMLFLIPFLQRRELRKREAQEKIEIVKDERTNSEINESLPNGLVNGKISSNNNLSDG
jgi:MFS family permease